LRLQIVLALAGLMALAFVPLFFAVVSLTRATLLGVREESSRALGRAVAAHVGDVLHSGDRAAVARRLESDVGQGGVEAVCIYDAAGRLEVSAGDAEEIASIRAPSLPYGEATLTVRGKRGRALDVVVPVDDGAVVARLRTDDAADQAAPLVGLVAIYMSSFALALLFFAYFALTRLIVRPIEALVQSADRVASARAALSVPRAGARELAELGASLQAMTARFMTDEAAMRAKVDELTRTTSRLTDAQTQLARSERLASVGRLSAGIAHEIGNPIAALMGMEDLLLDGDLPADTQRDFLARMKRETERIHRILRDLLDFARPEESVPSTATPAVPANVADVLADVLALVRPQKGFKSLDVRTDTEADLPVVALSPQRLTQVLLNLVLNAGAAVTSGTPSTRTDGSGEPGGLIVVRARRAGESVRIEVEDSGPGIAPAVRERIFEPFVTTKEVGTGTGLGLAVCRGIVESAGGTINLDDGFETGARFVVILPVARSQSSQSESGTTGS
jgi:signal transduction histidine kinase